MAEEGRGQQEVRGPRSPGEGSPKGGDEDTETEGLTLEQREGFFQISSSDL